MSDKQSQTRTETSPPHLHPQTNDRKRHPHPTNPHRNFPNPHATKRTLHTHKRRIRAIPVRATGSPLDYRKSAMRQ